MTEQTPAGFDMLPSPYFFVPMDEKVWTPDDPTPSHDRPVRDGVSGHLKITLTAKTPIFIRSAGSHPELGRDGLTTKEQVTEAKRTSVAYQSFYTLPDSTPAIPATSFNGMLRNVFEIITFSKLQPVPEDAMSVNEGRRGRVAYGPMERGRSKAHTQPAPVFLDAAERVFGTVADQFGLRKRVTATPLRCTGHPIPITDRGRGLRTVVGTPRTTFYPHYVEQPGASRGRIRGHSHANSNTKDFRVSGWKRYAVSPVPDDGIPLIPPPNNNEDVCTWFRPLPTGTAFTGDLHFHNLRPWEFGALLWALTFGGREDLCHSIGFGKPLGLGAVQLSIAWQRSSVLDAHSQPVPTTDIGWQKSQRDLFEGELRNASILAPGQCLADHPAIRDLILLADLECGHQAENVLHHPRDVKHFAKAKQQGLSLPRYHELFPDHPPPPLPMAQPAQSRSASAAAGQTQAAVRVALASDYPNEATFKNRVLNKLTPGGLAQLAPEITVLSKPENELWRMRLLNHLASEKKLKSRLRERHPDCAWLA